MARFVVLIVAFMALIAGVLATEDKLPKLQIGEYSEMDGIMRESSIPQ